MLDLKGHELGPEEREMLAHPLVGGVILFTRNFESIEQVTALVEAIHAIRDPRLLVSVDHEGGRVQRFRQGFTRLPAVAHLGEVYNGDKRRARRLAEACGWVMASELRAVGIDFSFAPVLDMDRGLCEVIGDRAFHQQPHIIAELAGAYMQGMHRAGMAATGKHFPGHGGVVGDSHLTLPVDGRPLADILAEDVRPFSVLIENGLAAIMPAHVLYTEVDAQPAGFSRYWLQTILRGELGFQGIIFSDDLSMEGAVGAGGPVERAEAALAAGCDMVLVCNNRDSASAILDGLKWETSPVLSTRLARMHGRHPVSWKALHQDSGWQQTVRAVKGLAEDPSLSFEF